MAPPGNQAANGENKPQPVASGETGLLDSLLKPVMVLGSSEAVNTAVIGEMGFSILFRLAIRSEVELGLLKEVRLKGVGLVRNFFVVYKSEKHLGLPALKLKAYLKSKNDLDDF
ncbi:MAG: hypothetical protein ABIJ57_08540 [Pseudomonadota bacterium]|nr:hypothetical protein [Pseudomonadota bacterium]MBU3931236.1 hypothetical protein [Pseudomonadota bacterium]MBU4121521.1 hypothetical protein [Pseudomonadota bacterium]